MIFHLYFDMLKVMKSLELTSVIWKEGRYFVAQCLNVDVSSFGRTRRAAINNLQEALELYFEDEKRKVTKVVSPSIIVRELQHA